MGNPIKYSNILYCYNGGYFISLKSVMFCVGEDDPYVGPTEVISPPQEDVDTFLQFLAQHNIDRYPYKQYFLP